MALLLPLKSAAFGRAADAAKQGFLAAYSLPTPVRVYSADEDADDILAVYRHAVASGARIVVGPLTRNAVKTLIGSSGVNVPTLTLNAPEYQGTLPKKLFLFGLNSEAEARQVAHVAYRDGKLNALAVYADTPLGKRIAAAFAQEWQKLGRRVVAQIGFSDHPDEVSALAQAVAAHPSDMIFLAASAAQAGMARPYLDASRSVYATSQIHQGMVSPQINVDLDGITFVDMPWLLQPDHPAVMTYTRPPVGTAIDVERLYALGIDAARLVVYLQLGTVNHGIVLDGVTGRIRQDGRQFTRELTVAQIQQGVAMVLDTPEP
ncbi:MAG: penicillin-binding protein activator [Burkholderiales bacterium]